MRWWVFVPALLVAAALDAAFMPTVSVAGFHPSLCAVLLAFVALHCSKASALAAGMLTGLFRDALAPVALPEGGVYVLGPHILAYVIAVLVVLQLRDVLFRKNAVAVAAAVLALAVSQALVFVALAGLRLSYADAAPLWGGGSGARAFGFELGDAVYSAVVALPVSWVLLRTIEAWGFEHAGPKFAK